MKVRVGTSPTGKTTYLLWCPACADIVMIDDGWTYNGNPDAPTFTPSLLTSVGFTDRRYVCHSFITDGVWQYLADSTHPHAGRSLPVVDLPDEYLPQPVNGATA